MLKKSLFFEEFSYITSFATNRYSQYNPLQLFDLSTWGQIDNTAGRGLITGWPSTQQGMDSKEIADTCVLTRKRPSGWYWDAVTATGEMWEA